MSLSNGAWTNSLYAHTHTHTHTHAHRWSHTTKLTRPTYTHTYTHTHLHNKHFLLYIATQNTHASEHAQIHKQYTWTDRHTYTWMHKHKLAHSCHQSHSMRQTSIFTVSDATVWTQKDRQWLQQKATHVVHVHALCMLQHAFINHKRGWNHQPDLHTLPRLHKGMYSWKQIKCDLLDTA